MIDILRALLGRWACPWCRRRRAFLIERLTEALVDAAADALDRMFRYPMWLHKYNNWVGRTGGGWHEHHHLPPLMDSLELQAAIAHHNGCHHQMPAVPPGPIQDCDQPNCEDAVLAARYPEA